MTQPVPAEDTAPGGLELPRPPGAVRRSLAAHPIAVDAFVAAVYLVPALTIGAVAMIANPSWPLALRFALAAIVGCALIARRQRPRAVFAIAATALGLSVFLGRDVGFVPAVFALYALAVFRSVRSAWIGYAITAAITLLSLTTTSLLANALVFYIPLAADATPSAFFVLAVCLVAVLIGSNVGNRRRYLDALIDRARQLAHERDQQAETATAAERSRIAREMHDIVSHSLTVMIALADGSARLADKAPARSAETMRMVAETGRSALADMRRLLGVLRTDSDEDDAIEPQPGVSELNELVERFRAAGLPVRITITGTPPEDTGQQLTVFRIVQEALTNALRYASLATSVTVVIDIGDRIRITIEDDATVHDSDGRGSGSGLLGLRERVALYGGTLEAGPRRGGGWRLSASFDTIPVRPRTEETAP
ncbi:sensor histidine kinase [Leifsonia xyli]|nr:histidine kinase [Leifsonia xyli]